MTIDLNNYRIRYAINDADFGVAFQEIPPESYRIAVYLHEKGSKLQMIN